MTGTDQDPPPPICEIIPVRPVTPVPLLGPQHPLPATGWAGMNDADGERWGKQSQL